MRERCSLLWLIALLAAPVLADEVPLQHPGFEVWAEGRPAGWDVSVGARAGDGPASTLGPGDEGGLVLAGDASTRVWWYVSQSVAAAPGSTWRLRFEARVRLEGEAGGFGNPYVGLAFLAAGGEVLARTVREATLESWAPESLVVRTPPGTARLEIGVFLPRPGRLEVRGLGLESLRPADAFRVLVEEMDRYYSFFDLKGVDWVALAGRYRERAEAAAEPEAFAAVAGEMLGELEDAHVWVHLPGGPLRPTYAPRVEPNADFRAVARRLTGVRQLGKTGFVGRTREGFGYLAIGTLQGPPAEFDAFVEALEGFLDAPGLLVDLRGNTGGDERRARRFVSYLTSERLVYARSKRRAGAAHDAFVEDPPRAIEPRGGPTYRGPIVVLVGPVCLSSGESFAMMLDALPGSTLVGRPTRGASGNPAPLELPNGVVVHYSRWVNLTPDGTPIEGRGIRPDVEVAPDGDGDPTFDAARAELVRRAK